MKRNKRVVGLERVLTHSDFCTKIKIYFSTKTAGDAYDPYENNYTYTNLNPITIKGYVSQLSPTSLVWNQYGLREQGALEVIVDSKYLSYFENANKIEIDNKEYEVYKEATGNRTLITERKKKIVRLVLTRTGKS